MQEKDLVPKEEIYAQYRRSKNRVSALGIALVVLMAFSIFGDINGEFIYVCSIALVLFILFALILFGIRHYWKCPMCYETLGPWNSKYCPHCATQLRD